MSNSSGFNFSETSGTATCGTTVATTVSTSTRRRAVLAVASLSQDAAECAEVLAMLGLSASEARTATAA